MNLRIAYFVLTDTGEQADRADTPLYRHIHFSPQNTAHPRPCSAEGI